VLGAAGLLRDLKPGAVVIDCSTSHPDSTRRLAQAIAMRHARMLDPAMTRAPREAALGKLNLLAGGADSALLLNQGIEHRSEEPGFVVEPPMPWYLGGIVH